MKTIDTALDMGFGEESSGKVLKINSVVMKGVNDREIVDFVEMTRDKPIEVRFIEYMPFDVSQTPYSPYLSTSSQQTFPDSPPLG